MLNRFLLSAITAFVSAGLLFGQLPRQIIVSHPTTSPYSSVAAPTTAAPTAVAPTTEAPTTEAPTNGAIKWPSTELPAPDQAVEPSSPVLLGTPTSADTIGIEQSIAGDCGPFTSAAAPADRFFTTSVEYLWWFIENDAPNIPLANLDPSASPVPLNQTGQDIDLEPGFQFQDRPLSGARFTAGYWLAADYDPILMNNPLYRAAGIELSGFFLAERSIDFASDYTPTLFRPFFDLNNRKGSGLLVAAPGVATGTIFGSTDVDMWGIEANAWKNVYANPPGQSIRIDLMGGFRFLNLDSNFNINSNTVFQNNLAAFPALVPFAGNRIDVSDTFETSNSFYGPQVGFKLNYITDCIITSADFKFGLGASHQELRIDGRQVRTAANGAVTVAQGGLFALPSNIGSYDRTRIGIVPEVNINVAFPIGRHFMFFTGYTFLGWSDVIRPGAQIDPVIDITQIPNFPSGGAAPTGLNRPGVLFDDEFLFVHGLNAGMKVIW